MKKTILFVSMILGLSTFTVFSQGIKFEENHDLSAALVKAKAENKLVFIDAYAVWCGPCKVMARDIFPLKEVGDFFNAHFVNLKLDMEANGNLEIAKKYEVKAYPTYLFLNAEGELVHQGLGSMPADKFIEVAKTATDSENNFSALSGKIKKGDLSLTTINKYLAQNPYDKGNGALVESYFQTLPENQIYTKENWELFNNFVDDISSPSFQYFIQNREKIAGFIGKKQVDEKIYKTMGNAYFQNPGTEASLKSIDPELFGKVKTRVDMMKANGKFNQNKNDKAAWDNLIKVSSLAQNQITNPTELNNMAWLVYENYKKFNDKNALKSALGWAKKAHETAPDQDFIADTYAHLLFETGKKKDALKMETKALDLATKAGNTERVEEFKKAIQKFKGRK